MLNFPPFLIYLLLLGYLSTCALGLSSVNPIWLANPYFQCKEAPIKTDVTTTFGEANPITANITFTKTFTVSPQLGFALKNYRGNDLLGTQNFALRRTNLNTTGFTIFTEISGYTHLRILTIVYLAVDKAFPYHLNVFNDIPANYSSGNLVNITGSMTGQRSYANTLNYTTLANSIGAPFNKFGTNLSRNKIALYLCAIHNIGNLYSSREVKFAITLQIINIDQFTVRIVVQDQYQIDLIKFSIVAMDIENVQSSGLYTIVFEYKILDATVDQYISIPRQFASATFVGILDYRTRNANHALEFNWELDLANDRIIINASHPHPGSTAIDGLLQCRVPIFYVKTWNCPTPNIYFNLGSNLCDDYCAKYLYANNSAAECQPCLFSCYQCVDGPNLGCTSCNAADYRQLVLGQCSCLTGYYPDPSGLSTVCKTCSTNITNCDTCQINSGTNSFVCLTCANGYALAGSACITSPLTNCLQAIFNMSSSTFNCIQCNNGYIDDVSGQCVLCSQFLGPECLQCSSRTQCTSCDSILDYYFDLNTNICQLCILDGCSVCSTSMICQTCNLTDNFFREPILNQTCKACDLTECITCQSLDQCSQCNETDNYILNLSTKLCEICPLLGCTKCASYSTCSVCDLTNLYTRNVTTSQCYLCDPLLDMFFNSNGLCQNCSLSYCLKCQSLNACSLCDELSGYFLNISNLQCQPCSLSGCLTCQSLTSCAVCDTANNWGLTHDGTCKQCPFTCLCDGYLLPKYTDPTTGIQYCSTTCGDGLVRNFEECDDGNTLDGDGCSAQCKIQKAWSCNNDPSYTCCTLQSTKIELKVNRIVKVPNQNSMTLQLEVKPTLAILTPENMQKFVTLSITGVTLFNERKSARNGQIMEVTYDYNQSIHGKKGNILFQIQFSQNGAPSCMISASKSITIMAQANNNLPFMFYDQADLEKQEEVADSVNAMEIITGVIFLLSMIPCKIIGLELIGVLQLAYFSLAQQENINILLEPFMKMNELNGMNVDLVAQDKALPDQVSALGIRALFLNNCNVMLFVVLAQVLTAAMLYGLGHVMQSVSQKLSSVSKYLIKEGLLTMMMFNAFNIAFGVGIHFQYADKNDSSYALSSVAAILAAGLIFGSCALLMFTEAKQFGEFKDKLKPNLMCQLYFVFSLAYRFVLGYYIAVKNEYVMSSLVIVGFSILFIGYNLVNLPFVQAYHNYRANICHVSQLVILLVTNYYDSLLQNQPLQQKAYQFSAAEIQIGAIYTAVGFSSICLFVEGYKFIKAKFSKPGKVSPLNSINYKISAPQINFTQQDIHLSKGQKPFNMQFHQLQYSEIKLQ